MTEVAGTSGAQPANGAVVLTYAAPPVTGLPEARLPLALPLGGGAVLLLLARRRRAQRTGLGLN